MKIKSTAFASLSLLTVVAHATPAPQEAAGGNLIGQRGVLRASTATTQPRGQVSIGTNLQYFRASNFLADGQNHARLINSYSLSFAAFRWLEAAVALHMTSDSSSGKQDELQVAIGDPQLALKGSYAFGKQLAAGLLLDLRFPAGAGFFKPAGSAAVFSLAALGSYRFNIPLSIHANIGVILDRSKNLFDDASQLSVAQRFAAQINSFHRIVSRIALEYDFRYASPFVELSLEPFIGADAPGFADSPGLLSLGTRLWATKHRSVQLLAALDIGLIGVAKTSGLQLPANKFATPIPRWNLLLRLSYRFNALPKAAPARPIVPTKPPEISPARLAGRVIDDQSGTAIPSARVQIAGSAASSLAVDAQTGTFRSFALPPKRYVVIASAEGYQPRRITVELESGAEARTTLRLTPSGQTAPGTVRGVIRTLGGKSVGRATILLPTLDRTIEASADGSFSLSLSPGEYKLIISARGFRTQRKTILVRGSTTVILNVEMHRQR
ncbi:MAG: carboxypeptidase regulatory-like domain-containing protein [Deltaproteobacteria bacterium]|nr:carboxypeptidase regulatory-like domain-containing protein [Deltaproteobacteria bacterium]